MPAYSSALRNWTLGDCPEYLNAAAPEGYGPGCASFTLGGHPPDVDLTTWLTERLGEMQARLGLTDAAASTLAIRYAQAFLWTIYYDPTGQVAPAEPLPSPQ